MQYSEDIAREIRIYAATHNLKQTQVADILGISRQAFYRRMNGETKWRQSELALLTSLWGVNFHQNHTRTANGT